MDIKKLRIAYGNHIARCQRRKDAAGNPIEMRLTFDEWLQIWVDSGKLHLRGRHPGSYCMSRKNDLGHYELGNVFIQSNAANVHDAQSGRCARPCTVDGITIYASFTDLCRALGQGKAGRYNPHFRYV